MSGKKAVTKTKAKAKMGRPLKFESPEEMQIAIDKYIERCELNTREVYSAKLQEITTLDAPIPLTIEGLCAVLEIDRQTLLNYQAKDDFFGIIKKTKELILQNQIEMAMTGECDKVMTIFLLKNNQGYADKMETHITGEPTVTNIEVNYVRKKD